jgi:hypothetical protein
MERRLVYTLGGLFGASVPATAAAVAWWLGLDDVAKLALIGIVAGAITGCLLAPWTVASRRALPPSLAAAALGVGVGIVVALVGGVASGTPEILLLLPLVIAYGIVLGFPVAGPTAFVAAVLLRITVRRPRWTAALLVSLLTVSLLLGIPAAVFGEQIAARRQLPSLRAAPRFVALLSVRLDLEIANCSGSAYSFRIVETQLDGTQSAQIWTASPQAALRAVWRLEPGWKGTIEADSAAALRPAWRGPHGAIRDALGADVVARLEIASYGEWSLRLPSVTGLTGVALCPLEAVPSRSSPGHR